MNIDLRGIALVALRDVPEVATNHAQESEDIRGTTSAPKPPESFRQILLA
jgi:hypothetical protein